MMQSRAGIRLQKRFLSERLDIPLISLHILIIFPLCILPRITLNKQITYKNNHHVPIILSFFQEWQI